MMVRKIKKSKNHTKTKKNKLKCKFIKNNYKNFIIYPVNKKKNTAALALKTKKSIYMYECILKNAFIFHLTAS